MNIERGNHEKCNRSRSLFRLYLNWWNYLCTVRTDRLQQKFGVEQRWAVFPLCPEFPSEQRELADLFAGRDIDIAAVHLKMAQLASACDAEFCCRSRC